MRAALVATIVTLAGVGPARADFFVVTDTFKAQEQAQQRAATAGGWTLDTDLYPGLQPGLFAVVRGPFASRAAAEQRLADLKKMKAYAAAYLKDGGTLRLPPGLAKAAPPKVLAALLGELSVTVKDRPGGGDGCEPAEPYQEVSITVVTLEGKDDPKRGDIAFVPKRVDVPLGAFRVIKRTGEIERMRICAE